MEAIAAAGSLPGLASATIQLGTATFQFYQQLHSLYKAIKHGENDLSTAVRRLDQHGDFIKELRFNFERIHNGSISTSTRDLFERYIADSEAEVEEFRRLLDRVGKHHFKSKPWQAVETGSRLRFHERSIEKYCDILDKQMQRFLFLQSSIQSMRVESTLSEVMETLAKQGAKAVAFYDEQSSLRKIDGEPHSQLGTGSKETQLSLRGFAKGARTISSLPHDVIPANWDIAHLQSYPALCGTVTVTTFSNSIISKGSDRRFAYSVRFKPYNWISRTLVEWRCLISSAQKAPTLTLSVTTSIVCDDPDVLDALGLVTSTRLRSRCHNCSHRHYCRCPSWIINAPSSQKVQVLLDAGRLLKDHVLCPAGFDSKDIITAYFESDRPGHRVGRTRLEDCDSDIDYLESDLDYLSQHYLEYYSVIKLLLSYGFKPHLSNWKHVYELAVKNHSHLQTKHPRLIDTLNLTFKPIHLLQACGYAIPIGYVVTFDEQLSSVSLPSTDGVPGFSFMLYNPQNCSVSYLAHLITLKDSAEKIKEILDLDPLDLANEQHMFDRWLLGLFAQFRPEIASLLEEYLKSCQTIKTRICFTLDYIREEFKQRPCESNWQRRQDFLKFACFYGNAAIIQQLDIASLREREIQGMQIFAAQNSDHELFDVLMGCKLSRSWKSHVLPHTRLARHKLANDPVFLANFIIFLEGGSEEPLSVISSDLTLRSLLRPNSSPLPDYIRNLIIGQVQRYESYPPATALEIHSLMYQVMKLFCRCRIRAEHVLQNLHLYDLLRLLAQSSAFRSSLDMSSSGDIGSLMYYTDGPVIFPCPPVNGYSALMLALHCGMKPAVQILVDAGASILKPMGCGKSALSVARDNIRVQHPRAWPVGRGLTSETIIPDRFQSKADVRHISESTDKEMLEILLKALRDRGEVEREENGDLPMPSRWRVFRGKAGHFARWLFKPSYTFDPDTFRENSIYAILVGTLWFLSVLKVLKAELGDYPSQVANLLSRPVVILALTAWILSLLR
ncbi:hypothetical protein F4823DRAFT_601801 [Ustulina deusta]|nr:hypothetical protein F4823DRAFT_601801 [Ustulina deusta]